jgi:hypothetical protein
MNAGMPAPLVARTQMLGLTVQDFESRRGAHRISLS